MRHNSSLIFSPQTKEGTIRLSPWCEGTWRQVRQLRGSFITAIRGRINWFYKYASESSILYPDKSFLNLICCHCLSNFIAISCPKGVYDSRLTGLTGIMESPSGCEGKFIEWPTGGSGRKHINELFEILSIPSFSFALHSPAVTLFSLPHSQPNLWNLFIPSPAIHSSSHFMLTFTTSLHPIAPSKLTRTSMSSSGRISVLLLALSATLFHCLLALGCLCLPLQMFFILSTLLQGTASQDSIHRIPYLLANS